MSKKERTVLTVIGVAVGLLIWWFMVSWTPPLVYD